MCGLKITVSKKFWLFLILQQIFVLSSSVFVRYVARACYVYGLVAGCYHRFKYMVFSRCVHFALVVRKKIIKKKSVDRVTGVDHNAQFYIL